MAAGLPAGRGCASRRPAEAGGERQGRRPAQAPRGASRPCCAVLRVPPSKYRCQHDYMADTAEHGQHPSNSTRRPPPLLPRTRAITSQTPPQMAHLQLPSKRPGTCVTGALRRLVIMQTPSQRPSSGMRPARPRRRRTGGRLASSSRQAHRRSRRSRPEAPRRPPRSRLLRVRWQELAGGMRRTSLEGWTRCKPIRKGACGPHCKPTQRHRQSVLH